MKEKVDISIKRKSGHFYKLATLEFGNCRNFIEMSSLRFLEMSSSNS